MKASKIILPILLVLLLVIAGGIYYSNRNKAAQTMASESPSPTAMTDATPIDLTTQPGTDSAMMASGSSTGSTSQEIIVTGTNYRFTPSTIRVKKGQLVKITFKNQAGIHDLTIPGLNVSTKQISGGASETVTFTPAKAGSFEFYCSVSNHRQMGMTGTLVVE